MLPANGELVEASVQVIVKAVMRIKGSVILKFPSVTCIL